MPKLETSLQGSFALLRLGNTAPFKKMSQWWRALDNTVFNLTGQDLNLRPTVPDMNALQLEEQNLKPL